jgi:hypothetical protein
MLSIVSTRPKRETNWLTVMLDSNDPRNSFICGDKPFWKTVECSREKLKLQNSWKELLREELITRLDIFCVGGEILLKKDKLKIISFMPLCKEKRNVV